MRFNLAFQPGIAVGYSDISFTYDQEFAEALSPDIYTDDEGVTHVLIDGEEMEVYTIQSSEREEIIKEVEAYCNERLAAGYITQELADDFLMGFTLVLDDID